jgi:hypothetical protein
MIEEDFIAIKKSSFLWLIDTLFRIKQNLFVFGLLEQHRTVFGRVGLITSGFAYGTYNSSQCWTHNFAQVVF